MFRDVTTDLRRIYVGSHLLYAEYESIEFRDACYLENPVISVKRMGEQLGMAKLDMPPVTKPTPKMIRYCSRDAEIVLRWIGLVTDDFKRIGVTLRRTLPSTALKYFKSVEGRPPIQPDIDVAGMPIIEFLRLGYYGGRTECFRLKPVTGPVYCADVNSMYPSVMLENDYPSPDSAEYTDNPNINEPGAYYCNIHAPPMEYPVLPIRHGIGGNERTVFPVGKFHGVWMSPELQRAEEMGYKIEPIFGVKYSASYKPFVNVIRTLYDWKLKGHTRAKFIMNSLYGKFGESGELIEVIGDTRNVIVSQPKHANVIWSAYVTAYSRLKLLDGILRVAKDGREPLYCDTDSIFYRGGKGILLNDGKALGGWGHKGVEDIFEAKCPKVYRWGDTFHGKGVPRSEAMGYFLYGMAEFSRPYKFREAIKRGLVVNQWAKHTKTSMFAYTKRGVRKTGETFPLKLGDTHNG